MENSKFFRVVWKFNGIVIALSGVLAVALLCIGLYEVVKDITRKRPTGDVVNIEQNQEVDINWYLGNINRITGHNIGVIPLTSDQKYSQDYYSKTANSERNYLFLNFDDDSQYWLFDHNNYLVMSFYKLRTDMYDDKEHVQALAYELVKKDTNSDKRLTASDLITLAITNPDGSGYTEVLTGLERIIDKELINSSSLLVIFEKGGINYSAKINLSTLQAEDVKELPKVGELT